MAMLPSPTPLDTRLMELWRASPAQKTPGRLVSSGNGWRSSLQEVSASSAEIAAWIPLEFNWQPRRAGIGPDHHKQGIGFVAANLLHLMRRLHANLNSFQVIFAVDRNNLRKGKNSILAFDAIWSIRYCDMLIFSPSPRTKTFTSAA